MALHGCGFSEVPEENVLQIPKASQIGYVYEVIELKHVLLQRQKNQGSRRKA